LIKIIRFPKGYLSRRQSLIGTVSAFLIIGYLTRLIAKCLLSRKYLSDNDN
jgi:hypothetical protein